MTTNFVWAAFWLSLVGGLLAVIEYVSKPPVPPACITPGACRLFLQPGVEVPVNAVR